MLLIVLLLSLSLPFGGAADLKLGLIQGGWWNRMSERLETLGPTPKLSSLYRKCSVLPTGFTWGVATASYQIEGAVAEGGRSQSIWDTFSHIPGKVANDDNGDVACDHYNRFREDVCTMASLGVQKYRFSISWSRLLPAAVAGSEVNPAGEAFYSQLIDALLAANITPVVTLYHWDLPQGLEDPQDPRAGWMGAGIGEHFEYYATTAFRLFGDRVKHWLTFNEPWVFCMYGYYVGSHAPGKFLENPYQCGHQVLRSHAAAVKSYRSLQQGGKIGIALSSGWSEPWTYFPWDIAAAQRAREFELAWFADPLMFGEYPKSMVERLGPALPAIDPQLSEDLKNSVDFMGINHYTTRYISAARQTDDNPAGTLAHVNNVWGRPIGKRGESKWLYVVPWGFRKLLTWIHNRYGAELEIWVTENGVSVPSESDLPLEEALQDSFRIGYYESYINAMCAAAQRGVNVRAYFAWSLMDNFEWADGYSVRFGLTYVDYQRNQTRYLKHSALWLANFFGHLEPRGGGQDEGGARELDDLTSVTL